MPDSLLIPVAKADIGRRLDQLLLVLVVLAIAVAWLAEPGKPLRFIAFAALIGLSWWVPRALNGSRRNTTCNPGSLCATARIQYRQPEASLAQLAEQLTLNQRVQGSSPWRCTDSQSHGPGTTGHRGRAPLAQLAEQLTLNQRVQGSSPWRCTTRRQVHTPERSRRHCSRSALAAQTASTSSMSLKRRSGPFFTGFLSSS